MRFSNSKSIQPLPYLSFYSLMFFLLCFFLNLAQVMGTSWFYPLGGFSLVVLLYLQIGSKYFLYDSTGDNLRFENRNTTLHFLLKKFKKRTEFSKTSLQSYKIRNYLIYKYLKVNYFDKNKQLSNKVFDITYLVPKKIKFLKHSLDKVLNLNTQVVN